MSEELRRSWRNIWLALRSLALWTAVALGTLSAIALLWLASIDCSSWNSLDGELQKAAVTIFSGGVLGGLLKFLFDVVSIERDQRNDTVEFLRNSLNDLKSVYDHVDNSRVIMMAHDTLKVYEEEMVEINMALVKLRNVKRAFLFSANDLNECYRNRIVNHLEKIGEFLNGVVKEFSTNYSNIDKNNTRGDARIETDTMTTEFGYSFSTYISEDKINWKHTRMLLDIDQCNALYKKNFTNYIDDVSKLFRIGLNNAIAGRSLTRGLARDIRSR